MRLTAPGPCPGAAVHKRPRISLRPILPAIVALLLGVPPGARATDTMALQPDGKVVVAGYASPESGALVRYNPDGSLDTSFGSGGIAIEHRLYRFSALALQPDGKIVVVSVGGGVELARFLPNGSPDPSFGTGGVAGAASKAASARFRPSAVLVRADGKIVVGGSFSSKTQSPLAYVNVYNPEGSYSGRLGNVPAVSEMSDLLEEPDGSLVMAGNGSNRRTALLARFVPGPPYDPSFGGGAGLVTPSLFPEDLFYDRSANALVADAGKLVIAGTAAGRPLLMRFDKEGIVDTGFGGGGVVSPIVQGSALSVANAAAVQPDGKVLIAGTTYSSLEPTSGYNSPCKSCGGPLVGRFLPNGSIDTEFGGGGIVHLTTGSGGDYRAAGEDVAVLPDGKILLAGTSVDGRGSFVLARYGADGTLDGSFGQGGVVTTLPCPGSEDRRRKTGCLPSAVVRLRLEGLSGSAPVLRLRVRPNVSWARMQTVRLLLPPALRAQRDLAGKARAVAVGGYRQERRRLRPKSSPKLISFNALGYARALHATLGNGFLRTVKQVSKGSKLIFRVQVAFQDTYRDEGKQTLVLGLAG